MLLNTLVYLFGIHFAIRGWDGHHQLRHKSSQLSIKVAPNARWYGGAENAGVENAGVENAGAITRGNPSEEFL